LDVQRRKRFKQRDKLPRHTKHAYGNSYCNSNALDPASASERHPSAANLETKQPPKETRYRAGFSSADNFFSARRINLD